MTRTRPCLRMILHFSHIGLTDGRTFMVPFGGDPDEDALATLAAAATIPRNGAATPKAGPAPGATSEYSARNRRPGRPERARVDLGGGAACPGRRPLLVRGGLPREVGQAGAAPRGAERPPRR